jgi:hypothetical protein
MIPAILLYAAAMIGANLSVATFGPWVSPINSFFLIGLDLTLRDYLHMKINTWQMAALIAITGWLSYLLNPASASIAIASSVSFIAAALVDWWTFKSITGSWMRRSMLSNVAGAGVDSIVFPTLAFGVLMPQIVVLQFAAKVSGAAIWAWLLKRKFA